MINLKRKNSEVYYTKSNLEFVNYNHINFLKKKIKFSKRKRARICLHKDNSRLHEMIIILSKDSYIRPHKHLRKAESLHVIEGRAEVIFFDNKGKVLKKVKLESKNKKLNFYYRLSNSIFHTFKIKSKFFIFHESTEGPFLKNKTIYAKWSPSENDKFKAKKFINSI